MQEDQFLQQPLSSLDGHNPLQDDDEDAALHNSLLTHPEFAAVQQQQNIIAGQQPQPTGHQQNLTSLISVTSPTTSVASSYLPSQVGLEGQEMKFKYGLYWTLLEVLEVEKC